MPLDPVIAAKSHIPFWDNFKTKGSDEIKEKSVGVILMNNVP